ncbi:VOC family protein [Thioalkalivibrio sp. ALE19]|uniref:VOC family protein n=1 Tax=Thioalkalivibrio sp. ALE19 TaxID=1266909 RepID=UPI00041FF414|nr:VOC family protein [Thioalkalivibrio sp. ALE19]
MSDGVVRGVHHVSVVVSDPERAATFYGDLLGLAPLPRPDLGFPGRWFDLGDGRALHLLGVPNPDPVERGVAGGRDRHLALVVDGLEALLGRLEAAGFPAQRSRSGRPAAFVRDPDGNTVEFVAAGE